jgi:HK97 family phage portal protein
MPFLKDLARSIGLTRPGSAPVERQPTGILTEHQDGDAFGMLSGIAPGGGRTPPPRGTADLLRSYTTMPWLRAVNNKVSHAVASTPWVLYTRERRGRPMRDWAIQTAYDPAQRALLMEQAKAAGELKPILDHPLLDALNGGNSYLPGLAVRKLTQTHLDIVGEAFQIKERDALGAPKAFWPVPPSWVQAVPTPQRPFYEVGFRQWQGIVPDSEMLWIVDPDPENPYSRGSGIARSLGDELETDEYAAKHTKAWFYNRARPDMIITADGLRPADTARLEQDWLNKNQGFWRAFKPYFLNKKVDVQTISQTFENMQLVPLRQFERDTIVQVYGVPPETLGILNASNRATIEAADLIFGRYVLIPRLEFLRATFQHRLVPEYDDRLIVDYVAPIIEDKDFRLQVAKTAPWTLRADEWRELMGRQPLPGGMGEVHHVPLYMAPTEDLKKMPTAPSHNTPGSGATQNAPRSAGESAYWGTCWAIARALAPRLVADPTAVRQLTAAAYVAGAKAAGVDPDTIPPDVLALSIVGEGVTTEAAEELLFDAATQGYGAAPA